MDISAARLEELITAKKHLLGSPKKKMIVERQFKRNDFDAYSPAVDEKFHVFMRQNTNLPENYSIGLLWNRKNDESVILFRCNGPHGGNANSPHRFITHTHRLNLKEAEKDNFIETDTRETDEFSTFEDAALFFFSYCGFDTVEMQKYFPFIYNIPLF